MCSQEQWDIYKLDSAYNCTIQPSPQLTTITRREIQPGTHEDAQAKRRKGTASDDDANSPFHKKARMMEVETDEDDAESDDDEVEELIVGEDGEMRHARKKVDKAKKQRQEALERDRRERRGLNAARARQQDEMQDVSMTDLTAEYENSHLSSQSPSAANAIPNGFPTFAGPAFSSTNGNAVPPPTMPGSWGPSSPLLGKTQPTDTTFVQGCSSDGLRDAPSHPESSKSRQGPTHQETFSGDNSSAPKVSTHKRQKYEDESPSGPATKRLRKAEEPRPFERNRSRSRPQATRSHTRTTHTRTNLTAIRVDTSDVFVQIFMDGRASKPAEATRQKSTSDYLLCQRYICVLTSFSIGSRVYEEYVHDEDPVSLEEKINRVREINEYERARARATREDAYRRAKEAEMEARRQQEQRWAREREQAARERREREMEQARRRMAEQEEQMRRRRQQEEEERRRRTHREERWSTGPWTSLRALEQYKSLSEAFDAAQFTLESPVLFTTIPWPVLHRPTKLNVEDVDWQAVEQFFGTVKKHMRRQDYKEFVEKSHRRFHPDRWKARRVLQSIEDQELRACLEVAANTVAQAITPIWRETKKA